MLRENPYAARTSRHFTRLSVRSCTLRHQTPKCGKHGLTQAEIEEVLSGTPSVLADPFPDEARMRAIGKSAAGRYVFVVFMLREIDGQTKLRPISARYMHQKEIAHYEGTS